MKKKLLDILIESLLEKYNPDAEKDVSKGVKAKAYIKYIENQISGYKKNNNVIRYTEYESEDVVEINFTDLKVILTPMHDRNGGKAAFTKDRGKNTLFVFDSEIQTTPKLSVKFDKQDLYHELIHFLDSKDTPDFGEKRKSQRDTYAKMGNIIDKGTYYNAPLEINAHFLEYVMPEVIKIIKKERELPSSYDDFSHDLMSNLKFKDFYNHLEKQNKIEIDKRMEDFYEDVLKNPDFKITDDDNMIDNAHLEKAWYPWWKKAVDWKAKTFGE